MKVNSGITRHDNGTFHPPPPGGRGLLETTSVNHFQFMGGGVEGWGVFGRRMGEASCAAFAPGKCVGHASAVGGIVVPALGVGSGGVAGSFTERADGGDFPREGLSGVGAFFYAWGEAAFHAAGAGGFRFPGDEPSHLRDRPGWDARGVVFFAGLRPSAGGVDGSDFFPSGVPACGYVRGGIDE